MISALAELPVDILEYVLLLDVEHADLHSRRNRLISLAYTCRGFHEATQRIDRHKIVICALRELVRLHRDLPSQVSRGRLDAVNELALGFHSADTPSWLWSLSEKGGTILAEVLAAFSNLHTLKMEVVLQSNALEGSPRLPVEALLARNALAKVIDAQLVPHRTSSWPLYFPARLVVDLTRVTPRLERLVAELRDRSARLLSTIKPPASAAGLTRFAVRLTDASMQGWHSPLCKWMARQQLQHVKLTGDFSAHFLMVGLRDSLATLRTLRLALSECKGLPSSYREAIRYILANASQMELLEMDRMPATGGVLACKSVREDLALADFADLLAACPRRGVRVTVMDADPPAHTVSREVPLRRWAGAGTRLSALTGERPRLALVGAKRRNSS